MAVDSSYVHAFREKVLNLPHDFEERASKKRRENESATRRKQRRLERSANEEEESHILATVAWIHEGVDEAEDIIFHPGFAPNLRKHQLTATKNYQTNQITKHCELRRYFGDKFQPPVCAKSTHGNFPCAQCKVKAAKSAKSAKPTRPVQCKTLAPNGIFVWTFLPPVFAPARQRRHELEVFIPGAVVGKSTVAHSVIKPQFMTSSVLQPLAIRSDQTLQESNKDFSMLSALTSVLDCEHVPRIQELDRLYQIFHYDDFRSSLAIWKGNSGHPNLGEEFQMLDFSLDNGPHATSERCHKADQAMKILFPVARAQEDSCAITCELDMDFLAVPRSASLLSAISFMLQDMWGFDGFKPIKSCIIESLLEACWSAEQIEDGNPAMEMKRGKNPESILEELFSNWGGGAEWCLETAYRLLNDAERLVELLSRAYHELRMAQQTSGTLRTMHAMRSLRKIDNVRRVFLQDLPWYRDAVNQCSRHCRGWIHDRAP